MSDRLNQLLAIKKRRQHTDYPNSDKSFQVILDGIKPEKEVKNWDNLIEACNLPQGVEPSSKDPELLVKTYLSLATHHQEVFVKKTQLKPRSVFQPDLQDFRGEPVIQV